MLLVSHIGVKVVSKDGEVHEDFEIVVKEVREDCGHTSLKYCGGVT